VAQVPDRPAQDQMVMVEARLALRDALLALPPGKRAVLVLRYLEDLPEEQGGRQVKEADQLIAGALRDIAAEAGLPGPVADAAWRAGRRRRLATLAASAGAAAGAV